MNNPKPLAARCAIYSAFLTDANMTVKEKNIGLNQELKTSTRNRVATSKFEET